MEPIHTDGEIMEGERKRKRTLVYPGHKVKPEDLLYFVETDQFAAGWDDFDLPEEELAELQLQIMEGPKTAPVIRGTHGLRKMRFSPMVWNLGKSGALRVCYVHFELHHLVLLVDVYGKSDLDTLPTAVLKAINYEIDQIEDYLNQYEGR